MLFVLPLLPAFAVAIGKAVSIGAGLVGIGAGVKGSVDYHQAKTMREDAYKQCRAMALRTRRETKAVQDRLEDFGRLKLAAYTGIIKEAAEALARFRAVDLTSFKDTQVERVSFLSPEIDDVSQSCVKASDVLSCLSLGVATAANGRFPYKDTPSMAQAIGAFGFAKLPRVPYAALAMAGLSWGISGNRAKTRAHATVAQLSCETEKLQSILAACGTLLARIDEGERLIISLTEKLRAVLERLQSVPATDEAPSETAACVETAFSLARALKQAIETDLCDGNGFPTAESRVVFKKIKKEHSHV